MSYLKNLIKTTGNEFASIVEEGVQAADVSGYIDTGSYIFNALLSVSYTHLTLPTILRV